MSPIEVYIDGRFAGRSSSGPSVIKLPEPPGGEVEWQGDGSGFGQIVAGAENRDEVFEFTEVGQKASFEVYKDLGGALFESAANSKSRIVIKRV